MASIFLMLALVLLIAMTCSISFAVQTLQDFCVPQSRRSGANNIVCKEPHLVEANDFFYSGLHIPGNTSNVFGTHVTPVWVNRIPGLHSFGISIARIDYAAFGVNPPHTHPRATEILTVLQGTLQVGFITSNPENRLITKRLKAGDVFVFPEGLVHFQYNVGYASAVAYSAFSSQNPGTITLASTAFGARPHMSHIPSEILTKAFKVNKEAVHNIQSKF